MINHLKFMLTCEMLIIANRIIFLFAVESMFVVSLFSKAKGLKLNLGQMF